MITLPISSIKLNTIILLGITLLLGLIGGELARRVRFLPKISGYILIGFLLGPEALNLISYPVLATTRLFVDISLGLILFDLGRHMDFSWLRHDRGLLPTAICESSLTFFSIFFFTHYFTGLNWILAALTGTFAMATSPAVVLMVANDLHAQGPVTRRTIILTSLNNFFALTLFTLLLPMTRDSELTSVKLWLQQFYLLFGSFTLSLVMLFITRTLAKLIGKNAQSQFVLFVGALIFSIGTTQLLKLPAAITLFFFGIATRNLDRKHLLMEVDFGATAQLFFILLFVVTGTYMRLDGFRVFAATIILLILLRASAKTIGLWLFSGRSKLTTKQILAISLALTPMAGLAISMSNVLEDFNPDINRQISTIIAAVVAILEILGPIATQAAFIKTNETESNHFQ